MTNIGFLSMYTRGTEAPNLTAFPASLLDESNRDTEIQRIAESIEELANIMKHLAGLVIDQGTILDRIDYNMDAAVEHTKVRILHVYDYMCIYRVGGKRGDEDWHMGEARQDTFFLP